MKFKSFLINIILVCAFFNTHATVCDSIGSTIKDGKKYIQYKIEKGTTLYSLSKKYNVSVEELKSINSLETLNLDQVILIPFKPNTIGSATAKTHLVLAGETLYSISHSTGVSIEQIKALNNLSDNSISLGQELVLTKGAYKRIEEFQNVHVVAHGETLYGIATKYKTSVDAIKKVNNLSTNELSEGLKLIIPKQESVSVTSSILIKKKQIKILNSKSELLDPQFCEVLSSLGNIGDIIKISTKENHIVYARIVGESTDEHIYASELVFKKLNITTFSSNMDVEFCKKK